jgi:hypothetical protein
MRAFAFFFAGAGALFAVQHVCARDIVVAVAHEGELHPVLNVFDMKGAAQHVAAGNAVDHLLGHEFNAVGNGGGARRLAAANGDKCLG